jgi:hypothetical protein
MKHPGTPGICLVVASLLLPAAGLQAAETALEWSVSYNDPANKDDMGESIALDRNGNVYLTGFEGRADIEQVQNCWTEKYNSKGVLQWTRLYRNEDRNSEVGYGIAVDSSGSAYVTGFRTGHDKNTEILLLKYDTDGLLKWATTYNSPGKGVDSGQGVALDGQGNIYVTGRVDRSDLKQGNNMWLRKYGPDCSVKWTKTYHSTRNNSEIGNDIAVDASGSAYVIGYLALEQPTYRRAVFIKKYDTDGNEKWTEIYKDSKYKKHSVGYGITVDNFGNVYAVGSTIIPEQTSSNTMWINKYDAEGNVKWAKEYMSPSVNTEAKAVSADGKGNIYVIGYAGKDTFVRKYDPDGNEKWTIIYNNPSGAEAVGSDIVSDAYGNIYFTGSEDRRDLKQGYNIFICKYRKVSNPVLSWTGETNFTDWGVYPLHGDTQQTYTYRVKYESESNEPPKQDYPKLHLTRNAAEVAGSPFAMRYVSGGNYPGAVYSYSTKLSTGSAYAYRFEAYDVWDTSPVGAAVSLAGGPEVLPYVDLKQKTELAERKYGKFTCKVVTPSGEVVYEVARDFISKDAFDWVPTSIPSGIYVATIEGAGMKKYKKIAIVRNY